MPLAFTREDFLVTFRVILFLKKIPLAVKHHQYLTINEICSLKSKGDGKTLPDRLLKRLACYGQSFRTISLLNIISSFAHFRDSRVTSSRKVCTDNVLLSESHAFQFSEGLS